MNKNTGLGRRKCIRVLGLSLVELIVAMVVIASLAGIAVPRYQNSLMRYRVERAAQRLIADFDLVRSQTRTLGDSRVLVFSTGTERYGIRKITGFNTYEENYIVDLAVTPYHIDIVSADFGGNTTVTFDGYGVPDSGGTVVLKAGGVEKTVTLNADTARATVP